MKVHTRLRCERRMERYGFEDPGLDTLAENIKMDLKDYWLYLATYRKQ